MDCQVCYKPYNTSSRLPKVLVCGHTFCTECLTKLQDATSTSIMCPKDRKMSAVPEGGIEELSTNFAILDLLSDDCSDCHEKTQDGQCLPEHCSKLLCSDCKDSHLKEFHQELVTELEAMKSQMTKQQAMCDDNSDLTKMMGQSTAAITEINRVFDAGKQKMIMAIRRKQEKEGNDYFERKKNFNVCLAKGRSFLDKVMSEVMFGVDSRSGKYLSELKKQIISEKDAISEVELGKSHFSVFDASGIQKEFDKFMPVLYDLVMPSKGVSTVASEATTKETNLDVKPKTPVSTAGFGAQGSNHLSGVATSLVAPSGLATSPVAGTRTKRTAEEPGQVEQWLTPVPDYTAVSLSQTYGKPGSGAGEFDNPWGVATSPVTGNIAISDFNNHRIHIVTADLHPIRVFGSHGTGVRQFYFPAGVCFSSSGSLFIADCYNHRIQQVTEEGGHIRTFGCQGSGVGQFQYPQGICWERGLLYICDSNNSRLQVMKESGEHLRTIGSMGSAPGQSTYYPWFIAVSAQHDKLVVSDLTGDLYFFSLDGGHRRTIRAGQPPYNLQGARGITIDSLGQVILFDHKRRCLVVLGEDRVISTIRPPAGEEMGDPKGVTVTQDGSIIVCDNSKHKIYKFTTGHH